VVGAHAALYRMRKASSDTPLANWARGLLSKKPFKLVAVALANKIARIAWVIMARNIDFQPGDATGDSAKVAASA
jgi:transposase